MRGRKPKPTAQKAAEGNPGKRRLNKAELREDPAAPRAPSHLSARARVEWRKLIPVLMRRRTISIEDETLLVSFCEACATLIDARRQLARFPKNKRLVVMVGGRVIERRDKKGKLVARERSGGSLQANPLLYVIRDQIGTIARIAAEFGLSPAARARLNLDAIPPDAGADPLDALLNGAAENDASDPVIVVH